MQINKTKIFLLALIFGGLFGLAQNSQAANWYVDNAVAANGNGQAWATAWKNFSNIVWTSVQPGDTVYISGGSTSQTYSERLVVGKAGTLGNVITIQTGQDANHNGVVILDGTSAGAQNGLNVAYSYVKVSGKVGTAQNMKVQNFQLNGLLVQGAIAGTEIEYIEFTQNGKVLGTTAGARIEPAEGSTINIHNNSWHNHTYGDEVWITQFYTGVVASYGLLNFYNNEIYDFHADAVKILGEGVSFYGNTIRDRGTYKADHPDGIQAWSGYLKIYNNKFYGFHRTDDNNVNSYIRYNPGTDSGQAGKNPNPIYAWFYNNLFYEDLPLVFAPASVVTHGGNTYTCKVGHYSAANKEPGVGALWETYWTQAGTGGAAWTLNSNYSGAENFRRGIELSFSEPTLVSANHIYFLNNTIVGTNFFGLFLGFNATRTTADISDIVIANNLFQDAGMTTTSPYNNYGSGDVLSMGNGGDGSITYGKWGEDVDVVLDYNTIFATSPMYVTKSQWNGSLYAWDDFKVNSGTSVAPTNALQDPLLDAGHKLTSESPYKAAGRNLSAYFSTDLLENSRGNWSIGAYEYVGADVVAPAAPIDLSVI